MLVGLPFGATFTFARPAAAPVRLDDGTVVQAAANAPRFDHDAEGVLLGMLVEGGALLGQDDRCRVIAGDWEVTGDATVFHELLDADEVLQRRALYTLDVRATVDGLLATAGHHRRIGAVAGFLRNLGGVVRYRGLHWLLPGAIAANAAELLGDEAGRVLIDG